jgi:thioredoxin 1
MTKNISELNKDTFENEVIKSKKAVLVDFWAGWCMPCRMIAPALENIAEKFISNLKVCKVNIDDENELAAKFGVMSIPTLIIFKDGKEQDRIVGALGESELTKRIEKYIV